LCLLLEAELKEEIRVLELGVENGGSAVAMAELVSPHSGRVVAVDMWPDEQMYCKFLSVSQNLPVSPHRVNLFAVDNIMPNKVMDFIHFDACYAWPDVKLMIQRYLLKVKPGGIVAGHGANFKWGEITEASREYLLMFPEKIEAPIEYELHPDVWKASCQGSPTSQPRLVHSNLSRALYEVFNDDYEIDHLHQYWWKRMV